MPPKKKSTKTALRRKRKPPQKNPPQKNNPFLRYLSGSIIIGALLASGYLVASKKIHKNPQTSVQNISAARQRNVQRKVEEKSDPSTASAQNTQTKNSKPSAMDILRYGFEEDAQGDAMPDISWYVPNQTSEKSPGTKHTDTRHEAPAPSPAVPSRGTKPKLAIIIDDISHKYQIDAIKALPYHITPSIFPPSELSKTSNQLTRYVKHYMVHLPMESGSVAMNRMEGMLFTRFSAARMQERVDEIRRLFPHAKFINNHTGSIFTSDYHAMKQLYGMLRKKGFVFVDSRTTGKSVVRSIAHAYHDRYIARDVFIDNTQTEAAVLKQLRQAVRVARKRGFAIAIGHPHKVTMKALRHAEKILDGVETVYIDELYPNL